MNTGRVNINIGNIGPDNKKIICCLSDRLYTDGTHNPPFHAHSLYLTLKSISRMLNFKLTVFYPYDPKYIVVFFFVNNAIGIACPSS